MCACVRACVYVCVCVCVRALVGAWVVRFVSCCHIMEDEVTKVTVVIQLRNVTPTVEHTVTPELKGNNSSKMGPKTNELSTVCLIATDETKRESMTYFLTSYQLTVTGGIARGQKVKISSQGSQQRFI